MVITAAELAAQGWSMVDILARLNQMRRELSLVLMVDSLEFLRRSGRLGVSAAWLGALLQTKPILTINQGQIEPLIQVRTKQKAMQHMVAELEARLARPDQPVLAGVMHLAADADMARLVNLMQARFNITRIFTAEFGPVIGTHLGPGALGVGLCPQAA
jgi:DegV family protein with EDD domain